MDTIRYVPIGDSYTAGEGTVERSSWPVVLTDQLRRQDVDVMLATIAARVGWTTKDALEYGLPVFERAKPTFGTLLIGINDYLQEHSPQSFRTDLATLMDGMLATLGRNDRLLLITIPDFTATPKGAVFSMAFGKDGAQGIAEYNAIIKEEAATRGSRVADIYPLSQTMRGNPLLVGTDDVHPSAAEYALWAAEVLPVARDLLKNS